MKDFLIYVRNLRSCPLHSACSSLPLLPSIHPLANSPGEHALMNQRFMTDIKHSAHFSSILQSIHPSMHSFIHSFVRSFIHSFMSPFQFKTQKASFHRAIQILHTSFCPSTHPTCRPSVHPSIDINFLLHLVMEVKLVFMLRYFICHPHSAQPPPYCVHAWFWCAGQCADIIDKILNFLNIHFPCIHTTTHAFTQPLTHSLNHSLIHSTTHSFTQPLMHSLNHSCIHSTTHAFTQPLMHSLNHSCIHPPILSFTNSEDLYSVHVLFSHYTDYQLHGSSFLFFFRYPRIFPSFRIYTSCEHFLSPLHFLHFFTHCTPSRLALLHSLRSFNPCTSSLIALLALLALLTPCTSSLLAKTGSYICLFSKPLKVLIKCFVHIYIYIYIYIHSYFYIYLQIFTHSLTPSLLTHSFTHSFIHPSKITSHKSSLNTVSAELSSNFSRDFS